MLITHQLVIKYPVNEAEHNAFNLILRYRPGYNLELCLRLVDRQA